MFESWVGVEPPGASEATGPVWSAFLPDGLLAEVLKHQEGGSAGERLERVGAWERLIAHAQAAQLREIGELAVTVAESAEFAEHPEEAHASVCATVAAMVRVAPRTASGRVEDAIALRERLMQTWSALSVGAINLASARAIIDETQCLDPALLVEAESVILERAVGQTPSQVRASTKRVVARLDPAAVRVRAEQARRDRYVRLTPEPDGMASLHAYLPAHEAVAVHGVLDDYARRARTRDDDRSMDARRADALVDLTLDQRGEFGGRARTEVRVTVALTTLLGLDELPGELAGYGPIPADVSRALAAEGTWRRLVTDPLSGTLLDYGTTRYRPPSDLAVHIRTRDKTCLYPGCRMPAHRCDLDHHRPYDPRDGAGPTSERNIGPMCRPHHRLKHSPGWSVWRNPDGSITWRAPTGHRFTRYPPRIAEPVRRVATAA